MSLNRFDEATICCGLFGLTTTALSLLALFKLVLCVIWMLDIAGDAPFVPDGWHTLRTVEARLLWYHILNYRRRSPAGDCRLNKENQHVPSTSRRPQRRSLRG